MDKFYDAIWACYFCWFPAEFDFFVTEIKIHYWKSVDTLATYVNVIENYESSETKQRQFFWQLNLNQQKIKRSILNLRRKPQKRRLPILLSD
jgi:hypothetical protein